MFNEKDENYVYYLVSQNLKIQRKLKNMSSNELAKLCNYSPGFIKNIECEKYYQTFSLDTVWQFAKALDIDIKELFKPLEQPKDN